MLMQFGRLVILTACITSSSHGRRVKEASGDSISAKEGQNTQSLLDARSEKNEARKADKGWKALLAMLLVAFAQDEAAAFRIPHGPGGAVLPSTPLSSSSHVSRPASAAYVAMMGPGGTKDTGFVEEMRKVAMRWHSPQQAKEGKKEAAKKEEMSPKEWRPTSEGYLRFLVESKAVYDALESLLASAPSDSPFKDFTNTGLERSEGLKGDIAWLADYKGLEVPAATGAGVEYAKFLTDLAKKDEAAFLCHYYNFVFAHSAGGRMIGKQVSNALLDGKVLNFYTWEDLDGSKARNKDKINLFAEGLSREDKDRCLEETMQAFDKSGQLLKYIAQ